MTLNFFKIDRFHATVIFTVNAPCLTDPCSRSNEQKYQLSSAFCRPYPVESEYKVQKFLEKIRKTDFWPAFFDLGPLCGARTVLVADGSCITAINRRRISVKAPI